MPDTTNVNPPSPDVIIAGAGIGGLSCALCFAKLKLNVLVLEKSHAPGEAGAGIQLGPNAYHILRHLGLEDDLKKVASFPEKLSIYDGISGSVLTHMPLGKRIAQRHQAPYAIIHRADLHQILQAHAGQSPYITLKYSSALDRLDDDGKKVTVETSAGETFHAPVLVGADGLWSTVREAVLADGPARYTGQTAWRATIRRDSVAPRFQATETGLLLGARAHLVHYPISNGQLLNIVAITTATAPPDGWSTPGNFENLIVNFDGWHPAVTGLLEQVPQWRIWALHDRNPAPEWGAGRVTLLGDAAHPMVPFLAQGGAMAIEDAWILAAYLKDNLPEPRTALRSYEALRIKRTSRVSQTSRDNAKLFHMSGLERTARNLALKASRATPGLLLRKYDWLYGYNALDETPPGQVTDD